MVGRYFCLVLLMAISGFSLAESFFGQGQLISLVADNRAHIVGDALTVIIVESTKAESRAGSGSESSFGVGADLFTPSISEKAKIGYDRDSADDANTKREGNFKGQISVRVVDIDEYGMLKVSGEQLLVINGEEQQISLTGYIRPIDVRDDNTVISTRVTDARIEFSGDGVVSDGQSPSIFAKIFSWFGL